LIASDILRSRHNAKILWVDDSKLVGDRIAEGRPIQGTVSRRKLSVASANWAHVAWHLLCVIFLCMAPHNRSIIRSRRPQPGGRQASPPYGARKAFFKIALSREVASGMKRTRHQLAPAVRPCSVKQPSAPAKTKPGASAAERRCAVRSAALCPGASNSGRPTPSSTGDRVSVDET
jgi:hypothetical protein